MRSCWRHIWLAAAALAPIAAGLAVPNGIRYARHIKKTSSSELRSSETPQDEFAALRFQGGASKQTVLVTGGVGYIGSHTVLELLNAGYDVIVVDNLCNSNLRCLRRVEELAGRATTFYNVDIRDKEALGAIFSSHKVDAVIHFAGLKAVGESVAKPLLYYQVNVMGTLNLIEVMKDHGCYNIVFSSSATVYGDPATVRRP